MLGGFVYKPQAPVVSLLDGLGYVIGEERFLEIIAKIAAEAFFCNEPAVAHLGRDADTDAAVGRKRHGAIRTQRFSEQEVARGTRSRVARDLDCSLEDDVTREDAFSLGDTAGGDRSRIAGDRDIVEHDDGGANQAACFFGRVVDNGAGCIRGAHGELETLGGGVARDAAAVNRSAVAGDSAAALESDALVVGVEGEGTLGKDAAAHGPCAVVADGRLTV